eukprot:TRINITY_DN25669_c0_g1_i1.p1 TRINITY_DN25669_c0_g1~~TRINITY_DN25669_c0_g1_i1.p1  ORF type:complete len:233 (+),score=43.98 TRINITY_DN25669_c0_g1_i1:71-769(+)
MSVGIALGFSILGVLFVFFCAFSAWLARSRNRRPLFKRIKRLFLSDRRGGPSANIACGSEEHWRAMVAGDGAALPPPQLGLGIPPDVEPRPPVDAWANGASAAPPPATTGLRTFPVEARPLPRIKHDNGNIAAATSADETLDAVDYDEEAANQREFLAAAQQLSDDELREFVDDHIAMELTSIRALPAEQRAQAFRALCAEWHPDKCPAIAHIATSVFQRLQEQKSKILQQS